MGKKLIMFIDDLNMPKVDQYGTQQPIALLKLFLERKGLYDRGKELSWKNMKDVQVLRPVPRPSAAARGKRKVRDVSFPVRAP